RSEVLSAESLASYVLRPITNDHPANQVVTPRNARALQIGTVGENVRADSDGSHVRAMVMITDAAAIADMSAGKLELSAGYRAEVDETPGTFEGKPYDAVQRNIRCNHVALVNSGRAGPTVRLRLDVSGEQLYPFEAEANASPNPPPERKS